MKSKINILIFSVLSVLLFSCEEDGYADYDAGETQTQELSGEWWIVGYAPDGTPAFNGGYNLWSTYNTAADNDSIWVDDHGSFFELKTRVQADVEDLTFGTEEPTPELYTEGTVQVMNGQIFPGEGRTATGVVVDSIYFEAEFDWDPGVIYTFGGHERSGFLEDEDPHL